MKLSVEYTSQIDYRLRIKHLWIRGLPIMVILLVLLTLSLWYDGLSKASIVLIVLFLFSVAFRVKIMLSTKKLKCDFVIEYELDANGILFTCGKVSALVTWSEINLVLMSRKCVILCLKNKNNIGIPQYLLPKSQRKELRELLEKQRGKFKPRLSILKQVPLFPVRKRTDVSFSKEINTVYYRNVFKAMQKQRSFIFVYVYFIMIILFFFFDWSNTVFIVFIVICYLYIIFLRMKISRISIENKEIHYSFSEEGITINHNGISTHANWSEIKACYTRPLMAVLYCTKCTVVIPTSLLSLQERILVASNLNLVPKASFKERLFFPKLCFTFKQ